MKKTIKYKIIEQAHIWGKPFERKSFYEFVWRARGNWKETKPTYGTELEKYISDGLIKRLGRNSYIAGDLAKTYLDDPKAHRKIIRERRQIQRRKNFSNRLEGVMIQRVIWVDKSRIPDDWSGSPVILQLSNGLSIFPMRDEEGNDAGALSINLTRTMNQLEVLGRA